MSAASITSVVTLTSTGNFPTTNGQTASVTATDNTVTAGSPVTAICTITNGGTSPTNPGFTVTPTVAVHSGNAGPSLPVILGTPKYTSAIIPGSGVASGVTVVTFTIIARAPIANTLSVANLNTNVPAQLSETLTYDIGAIVNAVDSSTGAQLECTSTVADLIVGSLY